MNLEHVWEKEKKKKLDFGLQFVYKPNFCKENVTL